MCFLHPPTYSLSLIHPPTHPPTHLQLFPVTDAALASLPTPSKLIPVFVAFFLDAIGTGRWVGGKRLFD